MPKGIKGFQKGHIHSEETRRKISIANKGIKRTDESKKHLSETRIGKHFSPTTEFKKGNLGYWKGKKRPPFSPNTLEKMSKSRMGSKHPCWKGGISKKAYPKQFNSKLKFIIRQRDEFKCQLCGRTEQEEINELNRVLCVNHIDFNKNNCSLENLNTLCIRCNLMVNWDREKWTKHFRLNYGIGLLKE